MMLQETYRVERAKWDALARRQSPAAKCRVGTDDFYDYATRTSTLVGVRDFLGDLRGKRVLEYGCGLGDVSNLLAKCGARVFAFDLSPESIRVARERSSANGLEGEIKHAVAAGERLPFADESFDVIFGKAILHHLDVTAGWDDLYRVLKKGGKAAFVEPMGMNPILNFVRDHVRYPRKNPRGADRPLSYDEIAAWGKNFSEFRYREIQLLSMLERAFGFHKRLRLLRRLDNVLLRSLPWLRRYCRYVVMLMVK